MKPTVEDRLPFLGLVTFECYRQGQLLWRDINHNRWTNEGLTYALNQTCSTANLLASQTISVGLINAAPAWDPANSAGDTYAQIGGSNAWAEWTQYSEATRLTWLSGDVPAGGPPGLSNANPLTFTMSAAGTVDGAFLCNKNVKGDNTGAGSRLLTVQKFSAGGRTVAISDELRVTYVISSSTT